MKRLCLFLSLAALLCLGRLTVEAQTTPPVNVLITLTGDNFTRQSTVFIGSTQFTPEYVSPNTLRVSIPRTLLSSAQPNNVRVVNPSAGGGSSAGLPLVVACSNNGSPNQLADFSMTIKTTTYSDLSEPTNENNLAEGQKMVLTTSRMPYISRQVISGTYFRDGNADIQISLLPVTDNPFAEPEASPNSVRAVRNIFINTVRGKATILSASNDTIFVSDIDSAPLRPITNYVQSVSLQLGTIPAQQRQAAASAAPSLPPPGDTAIGKSILLSDAYRLGFPITALGQGRYSIMMTPHDSVALAPNETVRIRVKVPEDIIERYEIFRGDRLEYRKRFQYDTVSSPTSVPRLRQTLSTSFFILEGLPMKQVVVEDYEQYTINLVQ